MASSSSAPAPAPAPRISIGTAGYAYAHWRKDVFYPKFTPQDSELKYFSGLMSAVEINTTFHGLPRETTFENWKSGSRPGFQFVLKMLQKVTHEKRLDDIADDWQFFIERAQRVLGSKLGPVLFQLPPSLGKHIGKLTEVGILTSKLEDCPPVAFEFRNKTWYDDEVFAVLRRYNIAICQNVSPDGVAIHTDEVTADWCYTRMHKFATTDETDYSDGQLDAAADQIAARWKRGLHQYIFFLNDHCGHGPKNVKTLMEKVQAKIPAAGKGLAPGWRPVKAVEKGGAGSIQGMFAKAKTKTKPAERQPKPKPAPKLAPKPAPKATHSTPAAASVATATCAATVKTSPAPAVAPAESDTNAAVVAATPPGAVVRAAAMDESYVDEPRRATPVGSTAAPSPSLDRASPDQAVKGTCGVGDTAEGWQCSACTFLNLKPLATICEMCQSSKPLEMTHQMIVAGVSEAGVWVGATATTPTGRPTLRKRPSADLSQKRPTPIKKSRSESSPASKSRSQPTGKGSIMKFFGKK